MQSASPNHADPITSDTPIMETAVPSSPVQHRAASANHTSDRKASHSSAKEKDVHDEGLANGKASELKPIGIINEQNTCFLNSTFQALSSTGPLVALIAPSPSSNLYPVQTSLLPSPAIDTNRIPCNLDDALEPPLFQLLPVTHAFVKSLTRAWRMKDEGGGTYGSQEGASHRSMSLRSLLRELARKYDQYDDYGQQDAHELLRHLLDSMEMEEKDVLKKIQPEPVDKGKKRRGSKRPSNAGVSPMPSPLPSPAPSAPSSPTKQTFDPLAREALAPSTQSISSGQVGAFDDVPEDKRLVPFVNVLFGGSLASVVVCENCKSVSHTYEGFLDISLSLKNDNPKPRKRDRFKAIANKLIPGKGSSSKEKDIPESNSTSRASISPAVVMSDTELSDTEPQERDRRLSLDQDDRADGSGLSRNSSLKTFGLRNKKSFTFGKKKPEKSRPGSSSSVPTGPSSTSLDDRHSTLSSAPTSPVVSARMPGQPHGIGPTAAQMAYIHRILAPPANATEIDPLAKLRSANAGNSGETLNSQHGSNNNIHETGLEESLRAFTSVEVLEGENAFACKRCWKIKSGRYKSREATLPEEDESALETLDSAPASPEASALGLRATHPAPPSINIADSETSSIVTSPTGLGGQDDGRLGRAGSVASRSSASAQNIRAPSPLRRQIDMDEATRSISNVTLSSSTDDHSGTSLNSTEAAGPTVPLARIDSEDDGLSDTDTSDEEQPDTTIHVGRPKPIRRQSSHFVMRRAFKRYLFAKAPEVLIFHFKRFKQTHKTSMMFTSFYDLKKMDDFVSFPEVLDLAPYMAPNRNDYKMAHTAHGARAPYMDWASPDQGHHLDPVNYRLYAVVVHLGTMIGGHYIAYCLVDPEKMFGDAPTPTDLDVQKGTEKIEDCRPESVGGKKDRRVWCFCSDTSIRLATVDEVLSARAYMCFYERVRN